MVEIPDDETGKSLKQFIKDGSDLTNPMQIDFFIAMSFKEEGEKIALKVQDIGFETSLEKNVLDSDWTCYCTKTIIPEYSEVVRIEAQLSFISEPYGGYLDGSYGNAGKSE